MGIKWLAVNGAGPRRVPAFKFLLVQPASVRIHLLAIVDAVGTTRSERWGDTTAHDSMHGAYAHLHEAHDRDGPTL